MRGLLTPSLLRAAGRVAFGLYVLAAVFFLGRDIANRVGRAAAPAPSVTAAPTALATALPSAAATAIVATPLVVVTVAPTPSPTPSPQPTPAPLVVTAYQNGGRRFAALAAPVGYTLTSPISGTASVVVYQFLEGEVRVGSNVPSEPFFPYVTITSAERRVVLRPGALNRDVQLLVKDGQAVSVDSPLFKITGEGASSWRTFYDRSVTAQVIVSVAAWPSGAEVDPVPLFKR
jgi:hypothetical protein